MNNKRITVENITAFKRGEHKAFDRIFLAYFSKVKFFIRSIIGHEEDAKELAQDIFVKLWETRLNINIDKSFDSLLYTMSRNAAFNYIKHKNVSISYLNAIPNNAKYSVSDTEELVYAKEIQLLIDLTVSKMPDQRKRIFQYSRQDGLTNSEIAERLNINKKTVENQLSLALSELKRTILSLLLFFL